MIPVGNSADSLKIASIFTAGSCRFEARYGNIAFAVQGWTVDRKF